MASITLDVGHGTATGIDPSLTKQLQESVGVVYGVSDPAARKIGGRVVHTSSIGSGATVEAIGFINGPGLIATSNSNAYRVNVHTGAVTSMGSLYSSGSGEMTALYDIAYMVTSSQAADYGAGPFGAVAIQSGSMFRLGMAPVVTGLSVSTTAGPGISGTFTYWVTEYDSVHQTESTFGSPSIVLTGSTVQPINQKVRVTLPVTPVNSSATKYRIYRSIDGGLFPIGWLVAEVAVGTATYDDSTTDASLVLNDEYRIITINGIPESMDIDPQGLALHSITSFQGSLVGLGIDEFNSDLMFTPASEPHSWPVSYRMTFPTTFGGTALCVRRCGDALYVAFPHELFRVNYLPDESDSVYDTNICIEHIANYGTSSVSGMCVFTGWGGMPVLFVASYQGPILVAGNSVDRAVQNIDWQSVISPSLVIHSQFKAIDNPFKQRVELYYPSDTTGTTWSCLHFYYDRSENKGGPLPDMVWTGPHAVPGPGTFAVDSNDSDSNAKVFTAGRNTTDTIYREDVGTTDAANLVDSDGTIQFRLRSPKVYPGGIDSECRADRIFIHKNGDGSQDYDVTFNAHRENGNDHAFPMTIPGDSDGVTSVSLNASLVSFDVRIVADGTTAMAPINNITVRIKDQRESLKTQVV